MVQISRLKTTGSTHLDRADKDAIHNLLDTMTFDASRRVKTAPQLVSIQSSLLLFYLDCIILESV